MGIHVAGHLLKQLDIWGCQRIYGVIGDANLDLLGELAKQSGVNYIACRTEMGAALMASAEAKLTGRPGVVLATSGPGIVSLLNGLADAAADGVPVLAITGQVERSKLGTGSKQEIDQQRLIEPIALFSALVADGKGFSTQLNLAFKAAVNRGGVAHLSIPKEMWREATDEIFYPNPPLMPPLQPQPEVMAELLSRLGQSTRPVFLVGRGIAGAEEKVIRLAETVQAAIIATMPAKSLIPNDHPLFAGGLGQAGSQSATDLLQMADLCVILGATWWAASVCAAKDSGDPGGPDPGEYRANASLCHLGGWRCVVCGGGLFAGDAAEGSGGVDGTDSKAQTELAETDRGGNLAFGRHAYPCQADVCFGHAC